MDILGLGASSVLYRLHVEPLLGFFLGEKVVPPHLCAVPEGPRAGVTGVVDMEDGRLVRKKRDSLTAEREFQPSIGGYAKFFRVEQRHEFANRLVGRKVVIRQVSFDGTAVDGHDLSFPIFVGCSTALLYVHVKAYCATSKEQKDK